MFKSVFGRYIIVVSLIIAISFILLAGIIAAVIGDYATAERRKEISYIGELAMWTVSDDYPDEPNQTMEKYLASRPELADHLHFLLDQDEDATIFLVDSNGSVVFASGKESETARGFVEDAVLWADLSAHTEAGESYEGEASVKRGGNRHILYATPVFHGEIYLGCAIVSATTASAEHVLDTTMQSLIMACLWIMLAMLVAMYFITERNLSPIRQMSKVAKGYAKGNFEERVAMNGGDELAELATAFNHMADELEHLEQKRNRFISDVSHELRSPMTSILGFVEGVADGSAPPEKQGYYLSLAADEIKRLSRLVADLLDVSRLEMGEKKMNFSKYNIAEGARIVLISLEARIEEKRLNVSFESDEDSLFVRADADSLYRVLYNLIENAIKFSREGGALRVSLKKRDKGILLEVYNEGEGIPKEDLPNVFDRFYKSDKSRSRDKKGVGLGLYFVKTIVSAHGGNVFVKSTEGEYCLFSVELSHYGE